jgi:ribose transport system permease protein
VIIAFVVLVVAMLVLRYTGYGRMVYAVGGNEEAARIAGIPVAAVRFSVYGIAAALAGLAGILEAARLTSAAPTAATGIELTAAAAVLLGGTKFTGGRGAMLGTLLGVLFLGVLANGITLAEIEAYWQSIVAGIVVIAALLLDRVARGESE